MNCRALAVAISGVLATGLLLSGPGVAVAAKKASKKPVVYTTKFVPEARVVELFVAMEIVSRTMKLAGAALSNDLDFAAC